MGTGFNSALVHKDLALRRLQGGGQVRGAAPVGAGAQPCVTFTGRVNRTFKRHFSTQLIEHSLVRAADNVRICPAMNEQMLSAYLKGLILTGAAQEDDSCFYGHLSQLSGCKVISRENSTIVLW